MVKSYLLLGLLIISMGVLGQPFQKLKIVPEKIGDGLYDFYVENPNFCPMQLSFDFTELENMQPSCEMPYVANIQPGRHKMFNVMRTYLDIPGGFKYDFQSQPGAFPVTPAADAVYQLPVSRNKTVKVISFDYSKTTTPEKIAWNFEMAVGDTVRACSSGVVCVITETQLRDTLRVGDNTITIYQSDGTFCKYELLADHSLMVTPGDSISVGDALGIVRSEKIRGIPQCRFSVYYVNTSVDSILKNKIRNFYTYVNPLFDVKGDGAVQLQANQVYEN